MLSTDEIVIPAPALEPFAPIGRLTCSICGALGPNRLQRWLYTFFGKTLSLFKVSFCSGGLPPVQDIESPIEQMMRGRSEERPVCGGIAEPHLHLRCGCCAHIRLMATMKKAS